jgi:hypothetical protein
VNQREEKRKNSKIQKKEKDKKRVKGGDWVCFGGLEFIA